MGTAALHSPRLALAVALLVPLGALGLVACGSSGTTPSLSPAATSGATPTAIAAQDLQIVRDVRYMDQRAGWTPALLDVYAPKEGGPWPVVVMLHGGGVPRYGLTGWAVKAAQRGAVVFVPDWGLTGTLLPDAATLSPRRLRATSVQGHGDLAAVVRFARGSATRYRGDPTHVTLFGHSAGASEAVMEAFSGVAASKGGLEGMGSAIPESLVLFDPDLLLAGDPMWDKYLAADPGIFQVLTPWQYVGRRVDFPVTVIGSGDPALTRPARHVWAKDSWLAVRDPSGGLCRGLQTIGAFRGGRFINDGALKLLVQRLRAAGDKATYVQLTDSTHTVLGDRGMESLLNALVPSARP
jgi:acetyl esterase/lipase